MSAPPTHIDHPAAWVGADMAARTGLWVQDLEPAEMLRIVIPATLSLTLGFQGFLSSFFLSVLGLNQQPETRR